jgi:hypothetical protein
MTHAIKQTVNKALPLSPIYQPNKLEIQKPKKGKNIIDKSIKELLRI